MQCELARFALHTVSGQTDLNFGNLVFIAMAKKCRSYAGTARKDRRTALAAFPDVFKLPIQTTDDRSAAFQPSCRAATGETRNARFTGTIPARMPKASSSNAAPMNVPGSTGEMP